MKKKILALAAVALASLASYGKVVLDFNIKRSDELNTLEKLIPDETKYEIDSIRVSGYFDEANFLFLRDCTVNGRLTGIDLSGTNIREIPALAFGNRKVNSPAAKYNGMPGSSKLQYITLPNTVCRIGYRAFLMSDLQSVTLPKIREIGDEAFNGCPLKEVVMSSYTPPFNRSGFVFDNIPSDAVLVVPAGAAPKYSSDAAYSTFGEVREQPGLYNIKGYYVAGTPLKTMMGDNLLDVDSVTVSGILAGADFETLREAVCHGRLSGIDMSGCSLEGNELPDDAFLQNSSAVCPETNLNYLSLREGVIRLGNRSLCGASLYGLDIPSSVRMIGEQCFRDSRIYSDLVIPEGVTQISDSAFCNASVSGDIYLPSTLEKVGTNSLMVIVDAGKMYKAKNFRFNRMTPPAHGEGIADFKLLPSSLPEARNWTLYVPIGAKTAFSADENWGKFANIVETAELDGGTSGIAATSASVKSQTDCRIYTLDGRYVGTDMNRLGKGVYVVNGKKIIR